MHIDLYNDSFVSDSSCMRLGQTIKPAYDILVQSIVACASEYLPKKSISSISNNIGTMI